MRSPTLGPLLHSLYRICALQGGDARSDADLLERFVQARDQEAFAALVQRHGPMVLAVCQRLLPDRHEAEDAFQATFLVLVRKAATLRQPQQLAPWLHGVAHRTAVRLRHRAARWQPVPEGLDPEEAQRSDPLDRLAWKEVRAILDEEIQQLPSKYRLPVVLCYLQGQSYAEAARSLGWPAGTVSVRLARARQKLRNRFVRRGLALSASLLGTLLGQEALAAPVPAALFSATVQAGLCFVAGSSALVGVVSQQVITLTEGVLQTMYLTKLKTCLLLALVVVLAGTGLGGLAWREGSWAQAQTFAPPKNDGQAQGQQLDEVERQLRQLEVQLQQKRMQLQQLRQGNALEEIETALKKLKLANAGEPQKRAAVEEFARAFGKLKLGLTETQQEMTQKRVQVDVGAEVLAGQIAFAIFSNGKVLQVDLGRKQVLLSSGSNDGVKPGQIFRVYQGGKASPNQTGWLRISEVASKWSIATIVHEYGAQGAQMRAGDNIQIHDQEEPKFEKKPDVLRP